MDSNIFIFSREIRSGKTTELMNWLRDKESAAGVLMPDVEGSRTVYDIASGVSYKLESKDQSEDTMSVGRFLFRSETVQKAREIIEESIKHNPDWLVIDEVGKLEVEQRAGFEPAVSNAITHYKAGRNKGKLILIIRDSLAAQATTLYGLQDARVINNLSSII